MKADMPHIRREKALSGRWRRRAIGAVIRGVLEPKGHDAMGCLPLERDGEGQHGFDSRVKRTRDARSRSPAPAPLPIPSV